jgi:predicted ATP-grasp superfamily ATP-dependent carboligase
VLLQEWIEGGDDHLYTYFGYHGADGAALATFVSRKLRQWPPHTGRGSFFVECRNDALLEAALRLFSSVPYRGFAHLEMKRDARDGVLYAVEANIGRPPGRAPIAEAGGVEVMYTAYCDALGQPLPSQRIQRYGRAKWIYFAKDVAAAWYYHRQGQLSFAAWLRSLDGIRGDTIFSLRDPLPFILDSWRGALNVLRGDRLDG